METVFVTTCKGRAEHVKKTLPQNLAGNPQAKFVLLDYGSGDDLRPYLFESHRGDIESGRLVVYRTEQEGPFRMAHAKNMAHRCGLLEGASVLVNLDADNFAKPGFTDYVTEQFRNDRMIFLWAGKIKGQGKRLRGCSGRIAVTSNAFLESGGYDETKYATWGPDDKDITWRLQRLGYAPREIEKCYLEAVPHTDGLRFKEYPYARPPETADPSSDEPYELGISPDSLVVNCGRVGMGEVFRNFSKEPMRLGPLPTRIFGIGMHKTATTSLDSALKILGYRTAHWESGTWAKQVWQEMKTVGKSVALEQFYAASDIPISMLYRELDKGYPGSKFILTVRSEEGWLLSVKRHWSYEYNRFRADWDRWPVSNQMHKEIYGQANYDALVMLARYRRHNAEVREYFNNRTNDLLVMDMEHGAGWKELCGFLGRPIPTGPYPKSYETVRRGS